MVRADTLEQLIGRLLLARISGEKLDSQTKAALEEGKVGGAVIFKENASSLDQLAELNRSIIKSSMHAPVLGVDQEGGAVQRFDHVLSPLPSAMALSAADDMDLVAQTAKVSAQQLKQLGFNCVFAPVLDVVASPLNPIVATRAFGDSPKRVAEFGLVVAKTIQEAGIVPVGKHFPGHGSTLEDSHVDLAVNPTDSRGLWQRDLVPFRTCLEHLPAIMMGHIWVSAVDEEPLPASLSRKVVTGVLREYLAYTGLIVTDDMIMKAITCKWGLPEACAMALIAGNDLVLALSSISETLAVHEYLVEQAKSGRLSEARIHDAVARVDKLFGQAPKVVSKKGMPQLIESIAEGTEISLKASLKAISILRGEIPAITSGDWIVLAPNHSRYPFKLADQLRQQAKQLKNKRLSFTEIRYSIDPSPEEAAELKAECSERNLIFLTYRSLANQGQLLLGAVLAEEAREKVTIALDAPFDVIGLPAWDNCLATLDPSDLAMKALSMVLLGEAQATGVPPVNLEFQIMSNR